MSTFFNWQSNCASDIGRLLNFRAVTDDITQVRILRISYCICIKKLTRLADKRHAHCELRLGAKQARPVALPIFDDWADAFSAGC